MYHICRQIKSLFKHKTNENRCPSDTLFWLNQFDRETRGYANRIPTITGLDRFDNPEDAAAQRRFRASLSNLLCQLEQCLTPEDLADPELAKALQLKDPSGYLGSTLAQLMYKESYRTPFFLRTSNLTLGSDWASATLELWTHYEKGQHLMEIFSFNESNGSPNSLWGATQILRKLEAQKDKLLDSARTHPAYLRLREEMLARQQDESERAQRISAHLRKLQPDDLKALLAAARGSSLPTWLKLQP